MPREERDDEDSDDGRDHVLDRDSDRQGLMGNDRAHRGWADLGTISVQNGGAKPVEGTRARKRDASLFVVSTKALIVFQSTLLLLFHIRYE